MPLMLSELQVQWGSCIRELREEQDMSLVKLARLAEVDQGQLSKIETGQSGVGDEARYRIAKALGRRVEEIFVYPDVSDSPS